MSERAAGRDIAKEADGARMAQSIGSARQNQNLDLRSLFFFSLLFSLASACWL
jgi:hypothetical protein